jgi:hypothetical protein
MSRWKYAIEFIKVIVSYIVTLIAAALPMVLLHAIGRFFYYESGLLASGVICGLLIVPCIILSLGLSQATARAFLETWGRPYAD